MYLSKRSRWVEEGRVRRLGFSSVQSSCSVVSDSLRPHESQHARPPCPSPTPGVHSNSCPLSRCCHLAISSSVIPFSFCPQSLPASKSFPVSQLFARWPKYWSFSFSISPSKEHPGLISFSLPLSIPQVAEESEKEPSKGKGPLKPLILEQGQCARER